MKTTPIKLNSAQRQYDTGRCGCGRPQPDAEHDPYVPGTHDFVRYVIPQHVMDTEHAAALLEDAAR